MLSNLQNFINTETIIAWMLSEGVKILLILFVAYLIQKFGGGIITKLVRRFVQQKEGMSEQAEKKREDTIIRVFHGTVRVVVWLMAGLMILSALGLDIGPILAGAGVAGVALGFGAQYVVRDFLAGLFIILENQYRVKDYICIDGTCGEVEDIGLRMTILRDMDGTVHYIPNGVIKIASNMSRVFGRINFDLSVPYEVEIGRVEKIINEVGRRMTEDEVLGKHIIKAPEFLRVEKFDESAVLIKITGETEPGEQWSILGELKRRIKDALDKEGIAMPYKQIVVHQKNN